ncbi:MAG: 1-(5-phosphoribosyl)-5-[(5-phosphoribosylamino)methylideneamino]imidazole-4-carboxamide isomerase [Clostridia bacterium]|nr:1-(5-phosphoribosyl)-5-[(5-phosphoribosylamino)methylideneamino]imidazole-4-carboxamide isomerase [Clostridia bacterium]MBO4884185.1 1-(5-phosphoribosyl)-5-[(5-phosphoribosylamino)methylideneamino]imidazole-4-carboxamide isomerase [Clostridia bacterium]
MLIFPAIDLRNGQVVRLTEGDYDRMTVYGSDALSTAKAFAEAGAAHLHVVDLDAARDGGQKNFAVIEKLARESGMRLEVGGGARSEDSARRYLDAGIERVILGSAAVEQPALLERLAALYPGRIAAGVDARDGLIAIHGWRTLTDIPAFDFVKSLPERGVDTVIYTDIARDGNLAGPNLAAYERLAGVAGLRVVASGGVSSLENVAALARLKLYAAIIGKALYARRIDLRAAIGAAREGGAS